MTYRDYSDVNFAKAALVPLMPADVLRVREYTERKNLICHAQGFTHRHAWRPDPKEEQQRQLVGHLGEVALAKFLGVTYEWPLEYDAARYDVAGHEVRSTLRFDGSLITHETDKPAPYVLALVHRISYYKFDVVLAGWIPLEEANQPQHWRTDTRAPAYFTPQTALRPIGTLSNTRKAATETWHGI